MTENAVNNYVNSFFFRRVNQMLKIFICAENRINFMIIAGVVMVIAFRFKDRIKINCRNSKFFQIVKFAFNSAQIAAVKVISNNFICIRVFVISRFVIPACVINCALLFDNCISFTIKSVGKNLIHYRVLKPIGSFRAFFVNCNLKCRRRVVKINFADSAELFGIISIIVSAFSRYNNEIVPNQAAFFRHGHFS